MVTKGLDKAGNKCRGKKAGKEMRIKGNDEGRTRE